MKFIIRTYLPRDFPECKKILEDTETLIPFLDTQEIYDQKSADDPESIWVAINEDLQIVGLVLISYDPWASTIRHLASCPVRGVGAGALLAYRAVAVIRERGSGCVVSYTDALNERSVDMQLKAGWEIYPNAKGDPMDVRCIYKVL